MQQNGKSKVIAGVLVIVAVALIAVAASMLGKDEQQSTDTSGAETSQQQSDSSASNEEPAASSDATYKDGTYTVSDTYPSPGGEEDIKVVLTLKDNVVTAVDVTQEANQRESAEYQSQFQQGYKSRVIGKSIATLELNRVSGSSLTAQAFDDALDQIRQQAEV